jgi:hypothetical protein
LFSRKLVPPTKPLSLVKAKAFGWLSDVPRLTQLVLEHIKQEAKKINPSEYIMASDILGILDGSDYIHEHVQMFEEPLRRQGLWPYRIEDGIEEEDRDMWDELKKQVIARIVEAYS